MQATFLGLVQGLTEWLPISSSGHLALLQILAGMEVPVAFDVLLHSGTLLSVCVYFRRELGRILNALAKVDTGSGDFRMALLIAVGTIPAAAAGLLLRGFFESLFTSLAAIGAGFLVTAAMLAVARLGRGGKSEIDLRIAVISGFFQAAAIAPGISRSGMTISSSLIAGADKGSAFRFSFLLSIPAILGALIVELPSLQLSQFGWEYLMGFITSAAAGFASIGAVRRAVLSERFPAFSIYCALAGFATLALALYG
ncbi:MAG: undecaprenyl-diphosphate phosphatase [Candidatus Verstraetearchaeota archaeon]|nr:undecaprenyl-diphosphate phosphatase [Candidatus Verstraetearchaeota archaeon]